MSSATAIEAELNSRLAEYKKIQKEIEQLQQAKAKAPVDGEIALLRQMFDKIDTSKDGSIELEELKKFSESLGYAMTEEEVEESFTELDKDKSGSVSFEELRDWWFSDPAKSNCLALRLLRAKMGGAKFLKSLGVQIRSAKKSAEEAKPVEAPVVPTTPAPASTSSKSDGCKIDFCVSMGEKLTAETAPSAIIIRDGASTPEDRAAGNRAYVEFQGEKKYIDMAANSIREIIRIKKVEEKLRRATDGVITGIDVICEESTLRVGLRAGSLLPIFGTVMPPAALNTLMSKVLFSLDILFDPSPAPFTTPDGHSLFSESLGTILDKALDRLTLDWKYHAENGYFDALLHMPGPASMMVKSLSVFKGCTVSLNFASIKELIQAAKESPFGPTLEEILEAKLPMSPSDFHQEILNADELMPVHACIAFKALGELSGPSRVFICAEAIKWEVDIKGISATQFFKYLCSEIPEQDLFEHLEKLQKASSDDSDAEEPSSACVAEETSYNPCKQVNIVSRYNDQYYCTVHKIEADHEKSLLKLHFRVVGDYSLGPIQISNGQDVREGDCGETFIVPCADVKILEADTSRLVTGILSYNIADFKRGRPYIFSYGLGGYSVEPLFHFNEYLAQELSFPAGPCKEVNIVSSYNDQYYCTIHKIEADHKNSLLKLHFRVDGDNSLGPIQISNGQDVREGDCGETFIVPCESVTILEADVSRMVIGILSYNIANFKKGYPYIFSYGLGGYSVESLFRFNETFMHELGFPIVTSLDVSITSKYNDNYKCTINKVEVDTGAGLLKLHFRVMGDNSLGPIQLTIGKDVRESESKQVVEVANIEFLEQDTSRLVTGILTYKVTSFQKDKSYTFKYGRGGYSEEVLFTMSEPIISHLYLESFF